MVGLALLSVTAAAVIVNAFADRFARWRDPDEPDPQDLPRIRKEDFGAVVAVDEPPALLYVDQETSRQIIEAGARQIGGEPPTPGALSAPTEVHLGVSDTCTASCEGCYLDTQVGQSRVEPADWQAHIDALAAMGVFEIALGGGESLHNELPLQIANYARSKGIVPNITTSGLAVTDEVAARLAAVMGQVNISLDGFPETYRSVRGWNGHGIGIAAIKRLVEVGARVGVNTVLVGDNVHELERLAEVLSALGVCEWQWLRFKPSGRGRTVYDRVKLTPEQSLDLWPRALEIQERLGLTIRFDCAMIPFLSAHNPPLAALKALGVSGCPGGESLWTVTASGQWLPCSFAEGLVEPGAGDLADRWRSDPGLQAWRDRAAAPPEPCASCEYQSVCRGGCRVVAAHLTGDALAADPECPRVLAS